ncbi:GIY-YIG nuclease family protein [Actinomycetaceae bacterium TAE3-ERU4]|nr:GIY-YIG nuclease family protein [Actinomycetaceae bacterium TAE3-ERU4]
MLARTIQLFLIDGNPSNRVKATLSNWTGIVYSLPRTDLPRCKDRPELNQTGIYLLFGNDENTGEKKVYIGQACERRNGMGTLGRINEHVINSNMDYFTHAVVVITSNDSFGPTEISYLENAFYTMAQEAGRYQVVNGNIPNPGKVTEEKKAELDEFIGYAQLVISSLGYKVFESFLSSEKKSSTNDLTSPILYHKRRGINACGKLVEDGFVVLSGSHLSASLFPSCPNIAIRMREEYAEFINEEMILEKDVLFSSPSTAAAFVSGASSNGKTEWKDATGHTLSQLENQQSPV